MTVPVPVYVTVNPVSVAGPDVMAYVTARPELAVAVSVAVALGKTGVVGCGKVMVCVPYAVPLSGVDCVVPLLFKVLSVNAAVPVELPIDDGVKSITSMQTGFAVVNEIEALQVVELSTVKDDDTAILVTDRAELPSFSSVIDCYTSTPPSELNERVAPTVRFSSTTPESCAIQRVPLLSIDKS